MYKLTQLQMIIGDGSRGYAKQAPYHRIIISAAAANIPQEIKEQLINGGRLVAPVGTGIQNLVLLEKRGSIIISKKYPGYVFVPLVRGSSSGLAK